MNNCLNNKTMKDNYCSILEAIKTAYKNKLLPLESHYRFHEFHSPPLRDADFEAKPMILLIGQYSAGKSTFIKYLLGRNYPGLRIGPEPTTDRFIAVMYDDQEYIIPGNALVIDKKRPFCALSKFGNAFLNRFQCSLVPSPILKYISFIDTPGILAGEKHYLDRGYDFEKVLQWYAERADRIILLFDVHKTDISDEFRRSIEALRGNDDKIRVVLNKADMIGHQELMRVYGALMWSLGRVLKIPEVARVYIGTFWDQPLCYEINKELFRSEEEDLFADLQSLQKNATLRKLNDLIKRVRLAKVHAHIIAELRKNMPAILNKRRKKAALIDNLDDIYLKLQQKYQLPPGDFPDVKKMQQILSSKDFDSFPSLKPKLLNNLTSMLYDDISPLVTLVVHDAKDLQRNSFNKNAFINLEDALSAYNLETGQASNVIKSSNKKTRNMFSSLGPVSGKMAILKS